MWCCCRYPCTNHILIKDLDSVYRHYDPENTGKIDYRNFIENLLFTEKSETESAMMNRSQYSQHQDHHE